MPMYIELLCSTHVVALPDLALLLLYIRPARRSSSLHCSLMHQHASLVYCQPVKWPPPPVTFRLGGGVVFYSIAQHEVSRANCGQLGIF